MRRTPRGHDRFEIAHLAQRRNSGGQRGSGGADGAQDGLTERTGQLTGKRIETDDEDPGRRAF